MLDKELDDIIKEIVPKMTNVTTAAVIKEALQLFFKIMEKRKEEAEKAIN